jgi:hypothetical protein
MGLAEYFGVESSIEFRPIAVLKPAGLRATQRSAKLRAEGPLEGME